MRTSLRTLPVCLLFGLTACGGEDADDRAPPATDAEYAALAARGAEDLQIGLDLEAVSAGAHQLAAGEALARIAERRAEPCVDATRDAATLTLDFGAGCPIADTGRTVQGRLVLAADEAGVRATLDDFGGAELTANGVWSVRRAEGERHRSLDLTFSDGRALVWSGDAAGAEGVATFDGVADFTGGDEAGTVTYADVTWTRGACWPGAGTAVVHLEGAPAATVTFLATTPDTGEVQVTVGRVTQTTSLPTEHCPDA